MLIVCLAVCRVVEAGPKAASMPKSWCSGVRDWYSQQQVPKRDHGQLAAAWTAECQPTASSSAKCSIIGNR